MSDIAIANGTNQGSLQYPSGVDQLIVKQGNVTVTGDAILNANLTVAANVSVSGNLSVTGSGAFTGNLTFGGNQVLTTVSGGLGYGQTWQSMTIPGTRNPNGTVYTNGSGKPIEVRAGWSTGAPTITVGGVSIPVSTSANGNTQTASGFIVPPGTTYSINGTVNFWVELR